MASNMSPLTDTARSLELLLSLSRLSRKHQRQEDLLAAANLLIAEHFQTARCAILLIEPRSQNLVVACEQTLPHLSELTDNEYACRSGSPWHSVLKPGRVVSLTRQPTKYAADSAVSQFVHDCQTKSVLVAPLAVDDELTGCLSLSWEDDIELSADIQDLAQTIAAELAEQLAHLELFNHGLGGGHDRFTANPGDAESQANKQLACERLKCQMLSRLHASLDRDIVLQTATDFIGRAFRVKTCVFIRIDAQSQPLVTHEYSQPDASPLGLGRTGQMPLGAVNFLRNRTTIVSDLTHPNRFTGLSLEDQNSLLERGTNSLLSCPIAHFGTTYGIIVAESDSQRRWDPTEIELIEAAATHTAVALSHARAHLQLKEQIFNMNLMSNLTQQLTSVLDQASRGIRPDRPTETKPVDSALAPLSARELEVLRLIASGLANREIAQRLFLTESTVELHASRIRKKLKLKSRTALVKFACDNHLV